MPRTLSKILICYFIQIYLSKKNEFKEIFQAEKFHICQSPLKAYFCVYDIFIPLGSLKIINSCFAVNVLIHRISRLTVLHGT